MPAGSPVNVYVCLFFSSAIVPFTPDPTQIAAIAAYLEIMPVPAPDPTPAKPQNAPQRDDN